MSFGFFILVTLIPIYATDSLTVYVAYLLAGKRIPYKRVFLLQIPVAAAQGIIYSAAFVLLGNRSSELSFYFKDLLFHAAELVIILSWVYFLFRHTDGRRRFFFVSTAYPIIMAADQVAFTLIGMMSEELLWGGGTGGSFSQTPINLLIIYASFAVIIAFAAALVRFLSRTKFWGKLQAIENYPKLFIPMGVFGFLFYVVFITFAIEIMSKPWVSPATSLAYLALLAVLVLVISDIKKTENLAAVKSLLLQQQNYINKLESIQRDIRGIQHDYKNMLAGLYAEASEGNASAVKEYIDTKLLRVDETVSDELRQINQLAQIEIPELKGLVMTKMLEAERDKVSLSLEVMFPVNRACIATEDLIRCVGILLDNAIEEARTQENAIVSLLLLQEETKLTVMVKNPVQNKPDLSQIWSDGYSTKGPGRGVGLGNYQSILRKYHNTIHETKIDGEFFVQVFVVTGS